MSNELEKSNDLKELENIEQYAGYNYAPHARTKKQIHIDFMDCCSLLEEGRTWAEIGVIINELRDNYDVSVDALKGAYKRRLEQLAITKAPEFERDRIIEDLDAIMFKMIMQYNESLEDKVEVKEKYEGFGQRMVLTEKVIKKAKSLGDVKFLEMYMKAQERKIKLMGLAPEEKKTYDINLFLQQNPIKDDQGTKRPAIQSEEDAKKFGESI